MKKFVSIFIAAPLLIGFSQPAAAQSGTCTGTYNICLQRVAERARPGQTEAQTSAYRADCAAARNSCMQTGTWSHNTAHITGLQKK